MKQAGWGIGKITLLLYPFGAGAVAINLFFAGLILSWVDLPVLTPGWSVVGGCVLGIPMTWLFARHIRGLMDRADGEATEAQ